MLKITIKAADEATFHRTLLAFVELSLERFDTDTLLDEARHRLGKKGYAVDVVPNGKPLAEEPEVQAQPQPAKRRPGRPAKNEVQPVQPSPQDGRLAKNAQVEQALFGEPAPSRAEVIAALEKYALHNGQNAEDGMRKARGIMAEVSGVKNAALKDVVPGDYRKLMEALA